ncbi:MAG: stalk domain-containing protein, partial [Clostridiales bacterium]|nr:stalk domain-containing protein [Clostridiales bacterium]
YEDTSVTLYDNDFGHDVQLKPGDKAVIVENGAIKDVAAYGPVKVPSGGFVVVASSSANVFYGNKNIDNSFSIGQKATWSWEIDSPGGYNFKDVYLAVGSDTAKINGVGGTSRPYIGGTADGMVSVGVGSAAECVNALFLDGGGSIAYYKDGSYLNGPGRNVSNAIGFVWAPPSQDVKVVVNGKALTFDQPPIIENSRTLVPLRAIFEALGATVDWNQSKQTVTAVKGGVTVSLTIGSNVMVRNGKNIALDVPAQLVGNRTLVPARAVAESFGAKVGWDPATKTVTITE